MSSLYVFVCCYLISDPQISQDCGYLSVNCQFIAKCDSITSVVAIFFKYYMINYKVKRLCCLSQIQLFLAVTQTKITDKNKCRDVKTKEERGKN